jgi:hypothetical protein
VYYHKNKDNNFIHHNTSTTFLKKNGKIEMEFLTDAPLGKTEKVSASITLQGK